MIKRVCVFICLLFMLCFCAAAQPVTMVGYYENLIVGGANRNGDMMGGNLGRLRLRLDTEPCFDLLLHLEPEYDLLAKTNSLPLANVSGLDQLVWDRAYFVWRLAFADITLGKQRIAWGAGYIWNPSDVFNPFTLSFAVDDDQDKTPIALRCEMPLGAASGLDIFVETDEPWSEGKKGARLRGNYDIYDVSLSYVDRGSGAFQIGFDTTGELFTLGIRAETALISVPGANRYIQTVLGGNYTFDNGWGLDLEYYFNGLGQKSMADYEWSKLLSGDLSQLGMDYYYIGTNKLLDELTDLRFSLLLNADDLSFIFYPALSHNLFQNFDLSLEAMFSGGQPGSEYMPTAAEDPSYLMGSNLILLRGRYSF
ncbi:MAG: hypothetical protein JW782_04475 [Candidatus Saganbacteria bacterium]|nr:hypothetical protein [Candidatus Saganbacteria bacterium]